ncbi:MAG: hypothetical protein EB146_01245, partial [Proteobacteria bacterium]|nr:hypothetical protein [Pseudomonadota bacterium]
MSINGHRLDYVFTPSNSDSELSSGSSSPNQYLSSDSLSTVTDASQHSLVSTVVHDHFRGEALRLQQQNGDAKYLRQLIQDINHLKSLVRSRDSTIDSLQKELTETKDSHKKASKECTKYHKDWLELYEKNHSLVCMVANLTIENGALKKELNDSQEINLREIDILQHKLKLTNDSLETAGKKCTKYHKDWLELLEKNHSLVCMVANLTI